MLKYLSGPTRTKMYTFYDTFIIAQSKYRYKGSNKWYYIGNMNKLTVKMINHVKNDRRKYEKAIDTSSSKPTFWFGKYRGLSVESIEAKDSQYIEWCKDKLNEDFLMKLGLLEKKENEKL